MKDRIVEFPNRYKMHPVPGQPNVVDLIPEPGVITEIGTLYNKAAMFTDDTAELYGLVGDDAVPDKALRMLGPLVRPSVPKYKLLQAYTAAGVYERTAPDLNNGQPYKIGVHIIGAGGGGAAVKRAPGTGTTAIAGGGSSGYSANVIIEVVPGQKYAVVVGQGGLSVTTLSNSSNYSGVDGNDGGSSAFDGTVVDGGLGGRAVISSSSGQSGGQGTDSLRSDYGGGTLVAPSKGELRLPTGNYNSTNIPGRTIATCAINPFDGLRRLGAGGNAGATTDSAGTTFGTDQIGAKLEDGLVSGSGQVSLRINQSVSNNNHATSPGSGGGGCSLVTSSGGNTTYTATSSRGADGAVFIYV